MNSELSIWEVAHRMCRVDIGPEGGPAAPVRDTIRWIVWGIECQKITAVDYRRPETGDHYEDLPNFWREFREGHFTRELLDYGFLLDTNFVEYCLDEGKEPPDVWQDLAEARKPEAKKAHSKPLRNSQEDRVSCRAIAQILWSQDPDMTIEDIGQHEWIQKFGNARHYTGRDTLRNWIKDLNPKPPGQRRGRPRKTK